MIRKQVSSELCRLESKTRKGRKLVVMIYFDDSRVLSSFKFSSRPSDNRASRTRRPQPMPSETGSTLGSFGLWVSALIEHLLSSYGPPRGAYTAVVFASCRSKLLDGEWYRAFSHRKRGKPCSGNARTMTVSSVIFRNPVIAADILLLLHACALLNLAGKRL